MKGKLEVMHGLPEKVVFCKRCVMSNQRPSSSVEFRHTTGKNTRHCILTKKVFVMHAELPNKRSRLTGRKERMNC